MGGHTTWASLGRRLHALPWWRRWRHRDGHWSRWTMISRKCKGAWRERPAGSSVPRARKGLVWGFRMGLEVQAGSHTARAQELWEESVFGSPPTQISSLVAQTVKNLPARQETQVQSLGWEDALEKGMATHSSILAWRIPWTEEPGGLQSWGCKESDMTEQLTLSLSLTWGDAGAAGWWRDSNAGLFLPFPGALAFLAHLGGSSLDLHNWGNWGRSVEVAHQVSPTEVNPYLPANLCPKQETQGMWSVGGFQ